MDRRAFGKALAAVAASALAPASYAADYPDRMVRLVVPYTAGGNLDLIARLVAHMLSQDWNTSVVVENRPGANGIVGTASIAQSAPDGYSLAMVSAGTMAISPHLYANMEFDPNTDLTCVSQVVSGMMILNVSPRLPIRSVHDLVAYAKANPGKLNFGSGGNGTLAHLSLEMLKTKAGIDIVHVPYRGTSLALNDLLGGQIQGMFDTLSTTLPYLKSGQIRGLAVTGATRSSQVPELPTVQEAGIPGYVADAWAGLVGPAGLPRGVIERLSQAISRMAADRDFREQVLRTGNEPVGSSPVAFARQVREDSAKWAEIVKISGARVD
ncbi:tripartite tricarboxylate transporter substrate binding protein [Bordetella sp. BOR01]|uniref:Bug family tripartite tricarboxylate transporter substrate binding protein n=1 Tax=Bordetella sp. BOR01 TaxID=2854779 RepID=UPI001C46BDD4|nr:tripartite tricarboxylate transporter substrate binding protein [Bordetella sp. BOR01]MBV7483678.1 tripartite tricarboxylate transporter substrate binding protein [Bordetella sp. BOR01]